MIPSDRISRQEAAASPAGLRLLQSAISHRLFFVCAYLLAILPSYVLPYYDSTAYQPHYATDGRTTCAFVLHLLTLGIAAFIAWLRGAAIGGTRTMLTVALIALAFDILPILVYIPFVPSSLHLTIILLGFITRPIEITESARAKTARHAKLGVQLLLTATLVAGLMHYHWLLAKPWLQRSQHPTTSAGGTPADPPPSGMP